jgi:GDP-4-dehydro-6-deoxy-D-mannose reductase
MKNLLLTGASGFVGKTLDRLVQGPDHRDIYTLAVPGTRMELRDPECLAACIAETRPDCVIHLAAQSFVPRAFENPRETFDINFGGTLNLLEALKGAGFAGKMLYVGSGDQYGKVDATDLPIGENHPLKPRNPYAVSKAAAEMLCYQWSQTEGMDIVAARPFNHIGAWQSENFALSGFAKQIVEIKLGRREPVIQVGDLDVTRDFTDVEDVARAYLLLLERGERGETYNVCSGREYHLGALLEQMLALAGVRAEIVRDPARFRVAEQKRVAGDNRKLAEHTGWQPQRSMEQSLTAILTDWEQRLSA